MFKIEVMCEDKHLAAVLRLLAGKTYTPEVTPVMNAKAKGGKVVQAGEDAPLYVLWSTHLSQQKLTTFTKSQLIKWLEVRGNPATSAGYILKTLQASKSIKRGKERGHWSVV